MCVHVYPATCTILTALTHVRDCTCIYVYDVYRRVWFLSACAYIPIAREVGLIIQEALNKQEKIKWVWLTLRYIYT